MIAKDQRLSKQMPGERFMQGVLNKNTRDQYLSKTRFNLEKLKKVIQLFDTACELKVPRYSDFMRRADVLDIYGLQSLEESKRQTTRVCNNTFYRLLREEKIPEHLFYKDSSKRTHDEMAHDPEIIMLANNISALNHRKKYQKCLPNESTHFGFI